MLREVYQHLQMFQNDFIMVIELDDDNMVENAGITLAENSGLHQCSLSSTANDKWFEMKNMHIFCQPASERELRVANHSSFDFHVEGGGEVSRAGNLCTREYSRLFVAWFSIQTTHELYALYTHNTWVVWSKTSTKTKKAKKG